MCMLHRKTKRAATEQIPVAARCVSLSIPCYRIQRRYSFSQPRAPGDGFVPAGQVEGAGGVIHLRGKAGFQGPAFLDGLRAAPGADGQARQEGGPQGGGFPHGGRSTSQPSISA